MKNTIQQKLNNASRILDGMSKERLIELWEVISQKKTTVEVAEVRGWILQKLEEICPVEMDRYYDGFYYDEDLRSFVLEGRIS